MIVLGGGRRKLEHEVGEVGVHTELGSVLHRGVALVGLVVLAGKCAYVAESEEGLQDDLGGPGAFQQFVFDEQAVAVRKEQQGFAEDYVSDLVGDGGDGIGAEVHHVFVPPGFVDVPIAMDAQVELLAVDDYRFVDCGKQQVLVPPETVEGDGQQAVIAAGIASDYAGIAISPRLVDADDLPLQRVGEVHEFRFIEF